MQTEESYTRSQNDEPERMMTSSATQILQKIVMIASLKTGKLYVRDAKLSRLRSTATSADLVFVEIAILYFTPKANLRTMMLFNCQIHMKSQAQ